MINLVSLNPRELVPRHMTAESYRQNCGMLTSPRNRKNPYEALILKATWAADNDCFVEFNARRILDWLSDYRHIGSTCLFFTAPDVVQNAQATLFNFWLWRDVIRGFNFPVAFVLQNGMEQERVPWTYFDALFIGGSTEFKYSDYVRDTVAEARRRGVWTHNGRVNTVQRIVYSKAIGCDSFDGTNYTRYPFDVANHLRLHQTDHYQMLLPEAA